MKRYVFLFFSLVSLAGHAQQTINDYKYVLIPEKFNFSKENDQYGLNTVTKTMLEEKGFTTYFDNAALPTALAGNRCNALTAEVVQKKGLFVTNLTLLLKDCKGNIIFKSKEGKSREKDYEPAFNLALKDAFTSLDGVPYAYNGTINEVPTAAQTVAVAPAPTAAPAPAVIPAAAVTKDATGTLYAQANANGYQLIDTIPKIVLTLLKTSAQDYFIAEKASAHGIVLKRNGAWYFEYYKDNQLTSEKLLIKF
ncbi:hypothetical protein GA0116948_108112 [Chitinophaga costaii]|uniref:Uncharacterized protein n=1 Tax=Chitinophaga costaii TaxID=1335309 RepID=A0A1C4EH93_9BACT|nr:hypothetical protein [Chitinophaga costaii]PUZ23823.1 hypothetical protein DCM91_13585 [Chitinophaga costaii]SCC42957.1 hypothetical protein GA0116948_108112 [Chitinophaga costaii]